jgi:DNA-binding transcriptional ArsR family regulator
LTTTAEQHHPTNYGALEVLRMVRRSGLDRLTLEVLEALVWAVDWKTWETKPYPGHEDDGVSVAMLGELAAGYSMRSVHRALPMLEKELGVEVIRDGRKGKTNRYSLRKALAKIEDLAKGRGEELREELDERDRRNEGKRPIKDSDYEPPREIARGQKRAKQPQRPEGVPSWLPLRDVPEPWTPAQCVELVVEVAKAMFGADVDHRRVGGLWRSVRKLWRSHGFGDPVQLARDVHRHMKVARECEERVFMFELRGVGWRTVDGVPHRSQLGEDRLAPDKIRPSRLLSPTEFDRRMSVVPKHEEGSCACHRHRRPPEPSEPEVVPEVVPPIVELLAGDVPEDADVHDLWRTVRARVAVRVDELADDGDSDADTVRLVELLPAVPDVMGRQGGALVLATRGAFERDALISVLERCADLVPFRLALLLSPRKGR